jgi:hypothetical protein
MGTLAHSITPDYQGGTSVGRHPLVSSRLQVETGCWGVAGAWLRRNVLCPICARLGAWRDAHQAHRPCRERCCLCLLGHRLAVLALPLRASRRGRSVTRYRTIAPWLGVWSSTGSGVRGTGWCSLVSERDEGHARPTLFVRAVVAATKPQRLVSCRRRAPGTASARGTRRLYSDCLAAAFPLRWLRGRPA